MKYYKFIADLSNCTRGEPLHTYYVQYADEVPFKVVKDIIKNTFSWFKKIVSIDEIDYDEWNEYCKRVRNQIQLRDKTIIEALSKDYPPACSSFEN